MRVRAIRNFKLGGKEYTYGTPFTIDDALGDKLRRTRYVVSLEVDATGEERATPIAPLETGMGMLRRETRTTAPIPNPPAGPEPLHPALLPHGAEELTEEHLDRALGGTLAEEVEVLELLENTDPDSEGVPAEERNAAAEDVVKRRQAQEASQESRPKVDVRAEEGVEKAPTPETRDPRAELEAQQEAEAERQEAERKAAQEQRPQTPRPVVRREK
jgi:hypothetical protein